MTDRPHSFRRAWLTIAALGLAGTGSGIGASAQDAPPPPAGPVRSADAPPAAAPLAEATELVLAGRFDEARARLEPILAASPDNARATFLLAMTHHRQRNYAAAEPLMVRALELDPSDFVVHHFLGWARLHLGQLEAAAVSFERHWRLQPGEPDTIFGLGLVALESGNLALAEQRFRETIGHIRSFEASDPPRWEARRLDLGKAYARLGEVLVARGDLETARTALERGVSIDPRQVTAWFSLSQVNRRLGDEDKADAALARFESLQAAAGSSRSLRPTSLPTPVNEQITDAVTQSGPGDLGGTPAPMPPVPPNAPPFTFTDVTTATGIDLVTTSGRDPSTLIVEVKGGGLALLDHDGDGDLDVLVPNGATLDRPGAGPGARLYENLGGMRFRDATAAAGLDGIRPWVMGVATGDVNADGFVDVHLACFGPDRLLLGGPDGRFRDATEAAGIDVPGWSTAASFGDADGDGDLDLHVTGYIDIDLADPPPASTFRGMPVLAGPMGLTPAVDTYLENQGDGTFLDRSVESGLRAIAPGYGLATAIFDIDGDGSAEIFVGNDSQPNRLLRRGPDGRYRDEGLRSGLATSGDGQSRATMGLAIADVNGDGAADVFTTNFAGEPNTLHVAVGSGFFDDATSRTALGADSRGVLGWGCEVADLDHDGLPEILVVNGHVYPGATRTTMLADERQPPLLMRRRPGPGVRFDRVEPPDAGDRDHPLAWLAHRGKDRTLILGDLDGDGDLDAVIGGLNQAVRVLRNDGASGDWIQVRPGGLPQGTRVDVRRGDRSWTRWIVSGTGYCSAGPPVAHIGLGPAGRADASVNPGAVTVTVTWADGVSTTRRDVAPNQIVSIDRPAAVSEPSRHAPDATPGRSRDPESASR